MSYTTLNITPSIAQTSGETRLLSWNTILSQRLAPLYVFLAALSIRLVMDIFLPSVNSYSGSQTEADSYTYHSIAQNLISGRGYSFDGITPTRDRTPTYPVFLAMIYLVFGPSATAILISQAFLGALTCLFAYHIGRRIFDARAGFLAAVVVAFYPALIYYDSRVLRESLTTFLLTAAVLTALRIVQGQKRPRGYLVVGAILAAVSMCRPETLLLTVPIGYMLVRPIRGLRNLWRPALLVSLPILFVWVPWTARNYITFGSLSPITVGLGSTLWFGSRWAAIGGDDHKPETHAALQKKVHALRDTTEVAVEQRFMSEVMRDIMQKPGWFLEMVYKKIILFWKDANGVRKTLPSIHPFLAPLVNAYYYLLLLLAVTGIVLGWQKYEWVRPLLVLIVTYMMTYALLHVRNRYRVPVLPVVFVLSAGGFWAVYDSLKAYLTNHWRNSDGHVS